ncbi:MAG: pentapeptide repeat-containing protein [Methylococcaceae bacterium]
MTLTLAMMTIITSYFSIIEAITVISAIIILAIAGMATGVMINITGGVNVLFLLMIAIIIFQTDKISELLLMIMYIFLGFYLFYRSFKYEEPMLSFLRYFYLQHLSSDGTNFKNAILNETDFNHADLKHSCFIDAKIIRCFFKNSKNLHLANTFKTVLEPLAVRELVLTGETKQTDFSYFNLRGINFAGLNLTGCNFYHADLSQADLRGVNLSHTDLSEVMALGTLFQNATLTGAIIDNWSIDKHTQFDNVICDFVYLKRDKSERNPPQGLFKAGEFAKLYQEIANTVDFIAHTHNELQALLRAIEKIKEHGGDIFIQQIERKADSVVIRVQSETDIDKSALYAEVQKQKDIELLAIETEYKQKLLTQEIDYLKHENTLRDKNQDLLAEIAKLAIQNQNNVNINLENKAMNDNSRHQSLSGNNNNVNFGDNNTLTNTIQQLPAENIELKNLLVQLQNIINNSALSETAKQKALSKTQEIAEVSKKPQAEQKNLVEKTLGYFNGLSDSLESGTEIALKLGETIAKITLLFGI